MVSAMGTEQADPDSDDVFQVYLRAKQAADDDLRASDLDWTVVRPGRLTDDVPTGLVQVGRLERGAVTRGDVAHVLAEVLEAATTPSARPSTCSTATSRSPRPIAGLQDRVPGAASRRRC